MNTEQAGETFLRIINMWMKKYETINCWLQTETASRYKMYL